MKYFSAVVELGSLTKASEVLGISHSGLSKAISVLQSETELELFRPKGRGLEITREGKEVYLKAQEVLKLIETLKSSKPAKTQSQVRMGLSEVLAITLSGKFVEALDSKAQIYQLDVGEIESYLLNDQIDFAIASTLQPNPDLEYLSLGKIRLMSLVRKDLYSQYGAEVACAVPITEFPKNIMGYKTRDGWPVEVERNRRYEAKNFAIAIELLRSGKAAIFAPSYLKKTMKTEDDIPIVAVKEHKAATVDREFFLIKHKAASESKAMKAVCRVIRKITV